MATATSGSSIGSKELIKYKGMQVAPAELEAVLLQHPAVADCAVYPQPDAEAGEIPKAAVVLRRGAAATADELLQFVPARVSPHKRVRALRIRRRDPEVGVGQDPAPRAGRAGSRLTARARNSASGPKTRRARCGRARLKLMRLVKLVRLG